jgi:hypothetical protein
LRVFQQNKPIVTKSSNGPNQTLVPDGRGIEMCLLESLGLVNLPLTAPLVGLRSYGILRQVEFV